MWNPGVIPTYSQSMSEVMNLRNKSQGLHEPRTGDQFCFTLKQREYIMDGPFQGTYERRSVQE